MRAVFVHVMADALGSVVVIISALLNIYHEKIGIPKRIAVHIDPTLSLMLVGLILFSVVPIGKIYSASSKNRKWRALELTAWSHRLTSQKERVHSHANRAETS